MSSEAILYGLIQGATYEPPEYRKLQELNLTVLAQLPVEDDFPFLTRHMFATPPMPSHTGGSRETFQSQVIHFGASMNGLDTGYVPIWVNKFEALLRQLFWFETAAHIWTDWDGVYEFWWKADYSIFDRDLTGDPRPSDVWIRKDLHRAAF